MQQHLHQTRSNHLLLQQWLDGPPSGEWRCYTQHGNVAFAAQRYPVNSIDVDLNETSKRIGALWRREEGALRKQLASSGHPLLEVDVWLLGEDEGESVVLGVRVPSPTEVEAAGVFTWEELNSVVEPGAAVVVRALTGKAAMAAVAPLGVPSDMTGAVPGALEELEQLRPAMLNL